MISLSVAFLTWHLFFRNEPLKVQWPWMALSVALGLCVFLFIAAIVGGDSASTIYSLQPLAFLLSVLAIHALRDLHKSTEKRDPKQVYVLSALLGTHLQMSWLMLLDVVTNPYFMD